VTDETERIQHSKQPFPTFSEKLDPHQKTPDITVVPHPHAYPNPTLTISQPKIVVSHSHSCAHVAEGNDGNRHTKQPLPTFPDQLFPHQKIPATTAAAPHAYPNPVNHHLLSSADHPQHVPGVNIVIDNGGKPCGITGNQNVYHDECAEIATTLVSTPQKPSRQRVRRFHSSLLGSNPNRASSSHPKKKTPRTSKSIYPTNCCPNLKRKVRPDDNETLTLAKKTTPSIVGPHALLSPSQNQTADLAKVQGCRPQ